MNKLTPALKEIKTNNITFEDIAKDYNLNLKTTDLFSINDITIIDRKTTTDIFNYLWDKEIGYTSDIIPTKDKKLLIAKLLEISDPDKDEYEIKKGAIEEQLLNFKQYFEVQKQLSEILKKANIKKYNINKDISDR